MADKTYVVTVPGSNPEEITADRAEFIAGQNRVTFFDAENNPVGSISGSGISFRIKTTS